MSSAGELGKQQRHTAFKCEKSAWPRFESRAKLGTIFCHTYIIVELPNELNVAHKPSEKRYRAVVAARRDASIGHSVSETRHSININWLPLNSILCLCDVTTSLSSGEFAFAMARSFEQSFEQTLHKCACCSTSAGEHSHQKLLQYHTWPPCQFIADPNQWKLEMFP